MRIVDTAEVKISEVKNQFIAVKEKGVSTLNKALNFFGVRSALSRLQGKLRDSVSALQQGVSRIEDMKVQIHEAGSRPKCGARDDRKGRERNNRAQFGSRHSVRSAKAVEQNRRDVIRHGQNNGFCHWQNRQTGTEW